MSHAKTIRQITRNQLELSKKEELNRKGKKTARDFLKEIYSKGYGSRQTASGRWRERDEPDEAEQLRQADAINKMMTSKKREQAKARLQAKGIMPIKRSSPSTSNECFIPEDINSFISHLRRNYHSGKRYSFREWLDTLEDLLGVI